MWPSPQVIFAEENFNEKLHFLCSVNILFSVNFYQASATKIDVTNTVIK